MKYTFKQLQFYDKKLKKAIMNRSKLRSKFLKTTNLKGV